MKIFNTSTQALCWAAEVEMATLEGLRDLKRTSKSELRRHEEISASLFRACEMFVDISVAEHLKCYRVLRHLDQTRGVLSRGEGT